MKNRKLLVVSATLLILLAIFCYACSKGGESTGNETPPSACAGVTVTIETTTEETNPGASTGHISITSPKGAGIFYKLNNGDYQPFAFYNNLSKGTYTITVKTALGCIGTKTVTITEKTCSGAPGTKFSEVKTIVQNKCAISGCHVNPAPTGNLNLQVDCNIVFNREKIFDRAVTVGDMPQTGPLTNTEKQMITAWINAGGKITD